MSAITRDEWLKALSEAGYHDAVHDEDAVTVGEFAEMFGLARLNAERRLKALVRVGKAKRTAKWGTASNGRRLQFTAYRLT